MVRRGPKREIVSRAYNLILRLALHAGFSDAQCGFKALRREAALELLPLVQDEGWFFDTELLHRAQRRGLRLREIPVRWDEDPDSRVRIVRTAIDDLRGVRRLRRQERRRGASPRGGQLRGFDPGGGPPRGLGGRALLRAWLGTRSPGHGCGVQAGPS